MDQLPDKWHVDWPRYHVDAIRAHVRRQFNFTNNYGLFGEHTRAAGFNRYRLRHRRHLHGANSPLTRLTRGLRAFFENVLQHVDHLAGISALELDKLANHFRRGDVHLLNHTCKLSNNVGILRH